MDFAYSVITSYSIHYTKLYDSAGGDLAMVEKITVDFAARARVWREARDLVYNIINCSKVVVSAMHGPAVGAGLVAGLLSDVSIAAKNARIIDGHTRLVV